ncbi:MAG: hypothetical protein K6F99_02440 [Lachnospiraceae bacterium]|nr:hypothetical protein [Lachnospiraceae bacterium]
MAEQEINNAIQDETERIDSPEKLNDYMRVMSPSVWMVIIAVFLLMAGFLVWAVFGKLEVHNTKGEAVNVAPITFVTD